MLTHPDLATLCLSLPGATRDVKWQDQEVFSVGAKMFCIRHLHWQTSPALAFKVSPERFLELTDQAGIRPAPYLARYHWVSLSDTGVVPADVLESLIRQSYCLVRAKLPKTLRDALPSVS